MQTNSSFLGNYTLSESRDDGSDCLVRVFFCKRQVATCIVRQKSLIKNSVVDLSVDYKSGTEFVAPFPDVVCSCEDELSDRGFSCRVSVVHGGVALTPLSSSPSNLSFLKDFPVRELDLSECPVSDISSLANLQLSGLSLAGSMVSDLAPIRGMPLEWIDLSRTSISDLSIG
jgi:hypothetical protein